MGHLDIVGPEVKIIRDVLLTSYDVFTLRPLVQQAVPEVAQEVTWISPGGDRTVFSEVIQRSNQHGWLDRLLSAVIADRPHRPDLRALALHFSRLDGWSAPLEGHGMDLRAGLEALTSAGDPFLDTTRLANWLIRSERQVCQVRCGQAHGTGFLVGPDLVMTCYHVVEEHLAGVVAADQVKVRFDYRRDAGGKEPPYDLGPWLGIDPAWQIPHARYSQADIDLAGDPAPDELDFALLKLDTRIGDDPPPGEDSPRGWIDLSSDAALPDSQSPILIVQHPGRQPPPPPQMPLQITFATPGFDGPNANRTRVSYKPSTLKGSSGSPVFGPSLRAVALHHNRGQINPAAKDLHQNNRGIPLTTIRAVLPGTVRDALAAPP